MAGRRIARWASVAAAFVLLAGSLGFVAWTRLARYPAFPEIAERAAKARTAEGWYVFESARPTGVGLVFYPGGLIDPAAYAPPMDRVAQDGVFVVIVPMPLDLAVFGSSRAARVMAAYPGIERWMVGGHSLGGAMAAEFASDGTAPVDGLVLLASYSAESTDLSDSGLAVLSIYGTRDGAPPGVFEASLSRLPVDTVVSVIEGGNHAQFGDYGPQSGDGEAAVSRAEQQRQTADAIVRFARGL